MIRHVVLLRLDPDTDRGTIDDIVDQLRVLPGQIDEIEHYHVGVDLGLAETNATIGVIGDFADAAAFSVYRDHPVHRRIIDELIAPVLRERSAIQFATDRFPHDGSATPVDGTVPCAGVHRTVT